MRRTSSTFGLVGLLTIAALATASHDSAAGILVTRSIEPERVVIEIRSEPFEIVGTGDGPSVRMTGAGRLMRPGEPELPLQRCLVALPPNARAVSVEVLRADSSPLPGSYRIDPFPPIVFLPDMPGHDDAMRCVQREWREARDAVYASDAPFPAAAAWLTESGALRKYSYACVAFSPFTYHPSSGRLEHHRRVDISISYVVPPAGQDEARRRAELLLDTSADGEASSLFSNLESMEHFYRPTSPVPESPSSVHDYVIITTSDLAAAVGASGFPSWKGSLGHQVRTVLITDSEITSQPGQDLAEQIRNFLRATYVEWGIQHVLLVGDVATVPMRVCYPDPSFHVYDPSNPNLVAPGTPTDYYYADLSLPDSDSWDLDGDGYIGEYGQDNPDFLAEVSVGRIPVNDAARITYTLDKVVAFEQDTGTWKSNVLHGASILFFENQDYDDVPFIDGAACLDSIETALLNGRAITHYSEQAGLVGSSFPWLPISESAFSSAWRTGQYAVVNWSGHGATHGAYRTVWMTDDGDGIPESGSGELRSYRFSGIGTSSLDDDHPSVVFAISCNVGFPEPALGGNLGIDLLTKPAWGASVGIVSAARPAAISSDWRHAPSGTEQICYEFNRYVSVEGEPLGDALYHGKFHATANYGWDHLYEYANLYNFNLYGDPSMRLDGATVDVAGGDAEGRLEAPRFEAGVPNPFSASVKLAFAVPSDGPVRIIVHDVAGRAVATLADRAFQRGRHVVEWDGRNERGSRVASGLYFVVANAGGREIREKVVLLQ